MSLKVKRWGFSQGKWAKSHRSKGRGKVTELLACFRASTTTPAGSRSLSLQL
ncbi:hypothetical protein E1A91_A01G221700v1 [Gossypium mustelinum]|uniref:Ribosomal protein L10e/L16 domain-containing protein n=1 Tax=Gossypium mustelinum TaxID=34275 RepID=A0A5D3AM06_GOSMU|nr:hypothetical protein E1A91_A01G221700v1 [Gossypium mustelinum]TYJ50627.1 hypothetical protein E1A91_A01G221700v1 [Gossypium mustelinum]